MNRNLPAIASVHLAAAVDDLGLAEGFLRACLDDRDHPVDAGIGRACGHGPEAWEVSGMLETCRLFQSVLRKGADGNRFPCCHQAVRDCLRDFEENPANAPGLERAALALGFAVASLDEAVEEMGNCSWTWRCLAAAYVLEILQTSLECTLVHGRRHDPDFGLN